MTIVAAFLGAASLLAVAGIAGNAQEVQARPLGLASGGLEATSVAFGCGLGFVPNRLGVWRPLLYGGYVRGYGRTYGFSGYR